MVFFTARSTGCIAYQRLFLLFKKENSQLEGKFSTQGKIIFIILLCGNQKTNKSVEDMVKKTIKI